MYESSAAATSAAKTVPLPSVPFATDLDPDVGDADIMDAFCLFKSVSFQHARRTLNHQLQLQKSILGILIDKTYTGSIFITVNPIVPLPCLYDLHMMEQYKAATFGELSPHNFAVAGASYIAMMNETRSQSIILSGENGTGKTETTKLFMQYLTYVGGQDVADNCSGWQHVLESNMLLEELGNTNTIWNDNSSLLILLYKLIMALGGVEEEEEICRFGKIIEIQFVGSGRISGAAISGAAIRTYLLEKSRVVQITDHERNYHCFYQKPIVIIFNKYSANPSEVEIGAGRVIKEYKDLLWDICLKLPLKSSVQLCMLPFFREVLCCAEFKRNWYIHNRNQNYFMSRVNLILFEGYGTSSLALEYFRFWSDCEFPLERGYLTYDSMLYTSVSGLVCFKSGNQVTIMNPVFDGQRCRELPDIPVNNRYINILCAMGMAYFSGSGTYKVIVLIGTGEGDEGVDSALYEGVDIALYDSQYDAWKTASTEEEAWLESTAFYHQWFNAFIFLSEDFNLLQYNEENSHVFNMGVASPAPGDIYWSLLSLWENELLMFTAYYNGSWIIWELVIDVGLQWKLIYELPVNAKKWLLFGADVYNINFCTCDRFMFFSAKWRYIVYDREADSLYLLEYNEEEYRSIKNAFVYCNDPLAAP